ncbi:MAG: hypothetical protein HUU50_01260 [Candidatus Brocadiae bacterium]|nr:hypothetical protein [Candidatus Brocadiia bacterium]
MILKYFFLILLLLFSKSYAVPVLSTTDIIADNSRSHFMAMNGTGILENGNTKYTENGITIELVNHGSNTFNAGFAYMGGGNTGYVRLKMANSEDFQSVGFLHGSGGSSNWGDWSLYNDGQLVASGTFYVGYGGYNPNHSYYSTGKGYLGFTGGGFDEIRVRDNYSPPNSAFGLHTIEVANVTVPETSTLFLCLIGLFLLFYRR